MPEVDYTLTMNSNMTMDSNMTDGSGSGDLGDLGEFEIWPITGVEVDTQRAGQVYAYRHNETYVVLGTRKREVFGTAVGIGVISSGQYQCIAINDLANNSEAVEIEVASEWLIRICNLYYRVYPPTSYFWDQLPLFVHLHSSKCKIGQLTFVMGPRKCYFIEKVSLIWIFICLSHILCFTGPNFEMDYIRFSTQLYSEIAETYNTSAEVISATFSTALLNIFGTDMNGQQIIECRNVSQ